MADKATSTPAPFARPPCPPTLAAEPGWAELRDGTGYCHSRMDEALLVAQAGGADPETLCLIQLVAADGSDDDMPRLWFGQDFRDATACRVFSPAGEVVR